MPVDVFVRFEPVAGKAQELLAELRGILAPTREEPGCLRIRLYESSQEPKIYFIHSEWVDEAAFELHATLPHMTRFLGIVDALLTHPLRAVRTREVEK